MSPDDWLSLEEVRSMVEWSRGHDGAFTMQLWSASGELRKPYSTDANWLIRDGDLRVVLNSEHVNLSLSHNLGFNLGSISMVHKGRLFSLGGRGFWNGHAKLIEFVEHSGEWEWVMAEGGGPECAIQKSSWFNPLTGQVFSIEEGNWGKASEAGPNEVWRLDLNSKTWERLGRINPIMDLFVLGGGKLIDLEDYFVWPGVHKSAIVRKSDHQTVFTTSWNWSDRQEAIAQAKEGAIRMTMAAGNRYRVLSRNEQGKETLWLDWDVASAFEAAAQVGDAAPWIVPSEQDAGIVEATVSEDSQPSNLVVIWAFVLLIVAGVSFGLGRGVAQASRVANPAMEVSQGERVTSTKNVEPANGESTSAQAILALISGLEEAGGRIMSTEELNDFLGLGHDVSSESKRAKRAQFIRDVNRVYQMRHGKEMIVREKDINDRRRTIYVIHPCSGTA